MIVEISGAAVSILASTLNLSEVVEQRGTCAFTVRDDTGETHYDKGQPVAVYDDSNVLMYAGVIDTPSEIKPAPGAPLLLTTVKCSDWHYLADKRIVAASYLSQTAGYIVNDLINRFLAAEGITAVNVLDGPTLDEVIFNYEVASKCLDAVATQANMTWYLDVNKGLHFEPRGTIAAPWAVTGSNGVYPDLIAGSVKVGRGNPKYRNRQYIVGGRSKTALQTETRIGDGNTSAWAMGFPLADAPTITVNGVTQTVGVKGVDTGKDCYWAKADAVVAQDASAPKLAQGAVLDVAYKGEYDTVAISEDDGQIADRKQTEGGGTGWVESVQHAPKISSLTAAFQMAAGLLAQNAVIGRTLTFQTARSGLHRGQVLGVTMPEHGFNDDLLLIESVTTKDLGGQLLRYTVKAIEGPVTGDWAKFFGNVIHQSAMSERNQINVGVNSVLVLLASFLVQWQWQVTFNVVVNLCSFPVSTLFPSATLYPA